MLDTKTQGGPSLNGNGNGASVNRAVQKEELVTIEANTSFGEGSEQVCALCQQLDPAGSCMSVGDLQALALTA